MDRGPCNWALGCEGLGELDMTESAHMDLRMSPVHSRPASLNSSLSLAKKEFHPSNKIQA